MENNIIDSSCQDSDVIYAVYMRLVTLEKRERRLYQHLVINDNVMEVILSEVFNMTATGSNKKSALSSYLGFRHNWLFYCERC